LERAQKVFIESAIIFSVRTLVCIFLNLTNHQLLQSFSNALLPPLTRSQGDIDTPWRKTPRANRKVSQKRKLLTSDEEPIKKQSKLDKENPIKIIDTINIDKKIKKAKKS
jgi:hypothetical protein